MSSRAKEILRMVKKRGNAKNEEDRAGVKKFRYLMEMKPTGVDENKSFGDEASNCSRIDVSSPQAVSDIPIIDISGIEPESEFFRPTIYEGNLPSISNSHGAVPSQLDQEVVFPSSKPQLSFPPDDFPSQVGEKHSISSEDVSSQLRHLFASENVPFPLAQSSEDERNNDSDYVPSSRPSSCSSRAPSPDVNDVDQGIRSTNSSLAVVGSSVQGNPSHSPNALTLEERFPILSKEKRPRTRRLKAVLSEWKANQRKELKANGHPYVSKNNVQQNAKKPKPVSCTKCYFKCSSKFTEEERSNYCKAYHGMDYVAQKYFLLSLIESSNVQRKSASENSKKAKSEARRYYLTTGGVRQRICKNFFLKTLCISHGPIDTAFQKRDADNNTFTGRDERGNKEPGNKTKVDVKELVLAHIDSFPTMESHYCRKKSTRKYLDSTLSITKMYNLFKAFSMKDLESRKATWKAENESRLIGEGKDDQGGCDEESIREPEPTLRMVSEYMYRKIFCEERNLSFFKPKKDQCLRCTIYLSASAEEKEKLEEEYQNHLRRKEEANKAKSIDKERASQDPQFVTATFDLQSVLQIPSSDVSSMYYSRKLNAFNLTIYEGALPNNAYCYVWTETNGARGSSEIGTAVKLWLEVLPQNVKHVSMFSDTCGGQNRNQYMASLLLYLTNTIPNIQIIEHKFLESGHTHMEADSMHSTIESAKKYVPVYTLDDWLNIMKAARSTRHNKKSKPYEVKEVKFCEFVDLKQLATSMIVNRTTDSQNEKINWLKIKRLKFEKHSPGIIYFSYDYESEYKQLWVTLKTKKGGITPQNIPKKLQPLYKKPIPVSDIKKKDLLKLCSSRAIPPEFHEWYERLPSTKKKIVEKLPEPSISEDEDEDVELVGRK